LKDSHGKGNAPKNPTEGGVGKITFTTGRKPSIAPSARKEQSRKRGGPRRGPIKVAGMGPNKLQRKKIYYAHLARRGGGEKRTLTRALPSKGRFQRKRQHQNLRSHRQRVRESIWPEKAKKSKKRNVPHPPALKNAYD